jgi:hypothetical protein
MEKIERTMVSVEELAAAHAEIERLREALRALYEEFAANFPAGENVAVDYAREVLGIKDKRIERSSDTV